MLERLRLEQLHIFQLPAVVALVARTAAPLQLGHGLEGDLIRGSEMGLISASIKHEILFERSTGDGDIYTHKSPLLGNGAQHLQTAKTK